MFFVDLEKRRNSLVSQRSCWREWTCWNRAGFEHNVGYAEIPKTSGNKCPGRPATYDDGIDERRSMALGVGSDSQLLAVMRQPLAVSNNKVRTSFVGFDWSRKQFLHRAASHCEQGSRPQLQQCDTETTKDRVTRTFLVTLLVR